MNPHLPLGYCIGISVWILAGTFGLIWLLRTRRSCDPQKKPWVHVGLSLWLLLALLTAVELYFALFFTASDAFNMTNVSQRWFNIYIDDQRNDQGFRDANELTRNVPEGTSRLAFFGDSFTVGHGIERMADRFSDHIAKDLEEKRPGRFVVSNLADPGNDVANTESTLKALLVQDLKLMWRFMSSR